ncbi:hypothetical protein KEJ36_02625, partial [Candidatus Bathyarchaeota archaeon]|nr:hypothetical protein [Candidatus Bathyarchaeota archaeon]
MDVRRWFDNLAAKSIVTATVYLRTWVFTASLTKTDAKAIPKVAKTKAFRDDFTDFITHMEREGKHRPQADTYDPYTFLPCQSSFSYIDWNILALNS